MSKKKRTLVDRLREMLDILGKLLNPNNAPAPVPIPVRTNEERPRRR